MNLKLDGKSEKICLSICKTCSNVGENGRKAAEN